MADRLRRAALYAWAGPTSAPGLVAALAAAATGGRASVVDGVLEVHGGAVSWLLRHGTVLGGGVAALTLGHVVLGQDVAWLDRTRRHERVHVRQCERWGPFFLPAYLLASLWVALRGGHPYRDNPFEREAYAVDGPA